MKRLTTKELTGQTEQHIDPDIGLHHDVIPAFLALKQAAKEAGFELAIASGFRSFERQKVIWNAKFNGLRPVLNNQSQPIDIRTLSEIELIHAIMRWSALPGASRHHWGTDFDIYAKNLLPEGEKLALEPWEYQSGGHQFLFSQWLNSYLQDSPFFLPYIKDKGGVATEPWHISYAPIAKKALQDIDIKQLTTLFSIEDVAGKSQIIKNIDILYDRYISNINKTYN
ncbi:M15 family metallopeptidase [Vibrio sp. SS-MA-C1-2]|uniref:M15 family metallopeptidase n=1 Tax=Vibrio sp. SS-MA-C1-2 TaxID=2908646 RepID=UPI001F453B06|nr:M15 family metallopeptidase [Vibrio sp. SS-MA-C1-2]UJF19790.1 M15 family metallopeptidase [Vibrio sp. SS-MA-C1-2]